MRSSALLYLLAVLQVAFCLAAVWLTLHRNNPTASATRAVASTFGVVGGLYCLEHGYYETLQGNVAPAGLRIEAVAPPCLPFPFGCEPAMTVIPDFFVTGILAMIYGGLVIAWSAAFIQLKYGGLILILLAAFTLAVGGGFATITLVLIGAIAGFWIGSRHVWLRQHVPPYMLRQMAALWPWLLVASMVAVPIELATGAIFDAGSPGLSLTLAYCLVGFFLLAVVTGIAYDAHRLAIQDRGEA